MLEKFLKPNIFEAGCDEAGRGCLAGPVFAAAVILPNSFSCSELNDSKKLTEKKREELRIIIEEQAIAYGIGVVDNNEIDQINVLNASFLAMHRAIDKLKIKPEHLIIDGNRFNAHKSIVHTCIIKGDGKYQSIAAASILAKTYRDDYMKALGEQYPKYYWSNNKGYPTEKHRKAIAVYGITPFHRKTFCMKNNQLLLNF